MKQFFFAISMLFLLLACKTATTTQEAPPEGISLSGEYRSLKGVQTSASCYCFELAELVSTRGAVTIICFEGEDEMPENCQKIKVWGEYTTKTRDEDPNSPCPAGEMRFFSVQQYECY